MPGTRGRGWSDYNRFDGLSTAVGGSALGTHGRPFSRISLSLVLPLSPEILPEPELLPVALVYGTIKSRSLTRGSRVIRILGFESVILFLSGSFSLSRPLSGLSRDRAVPTNLLELIECVARGIHTGKRHGRVNQRLGQRRSNPFFLVRLKDRLIEHFF